MGIITLSVAKMHFILPNLVDKMNIKNLRCDLVVQVERTETAYTYLFDVAK